MQHEGCEPLVGRVACLGGNGVRDRHARGRAVVCGGTHDERSSFVQRSCNRSVISNAHVPAMTDLAAELIATIYDGIDIVDSNGDDGEKKAAAKMRGEGERKFKPSSIEWDAGRWPGCPTKHRMCGNRATDRSALPTN
ncbi:hypothetical protein F511_25930 [Dorcoceras hygrometricum]|uniref:Uncharacterized protein n=1 Tax=Dorcoceras hygrometricum TaxID=472368 RepID=A0A2Z7B4C3_9LAMI|nr:hypothetical protein F511_25930 [Dorcoceras hygrometricum]